MNLGDGLQDDWEEHGPEKRRLRGSLIVVFYYLIGKYKEGKDFLKVPDKSTCHRNSNFSPWNNQTYSKLSWAGVWAIWYHFWSQPCHEQDPRQYDLEFTFNQNPPMFYYPVFRQPDSFLWWDNWWCGYWVVHVGLYPFSLEAGWTNGLLMNWRSSWPPGKKIVINVSRSREQPAECSNDW